MSRRKSAARPRVRKRRSSSLAARVLLAILAPIVALALLEVLLRIVGFGYPTSYFVPSRQDPARLVENPEFGRRFFPAGMLRLPPPTTFLREKPSGTTRILVFGESAAMGDPKPAFGVARFLEALLNQRFPERRHEVIPVAMTAISSHALVPMARECVELDADAWIIFAGNNEMLGPFGAGTVLGSSAPPWPVVRLILAARATRLGQAIEAIARRIGGAPSGSNRWEGVRVLAEDSVGMESPARSRVYGAFERNLTDMVRAGRRAGARVYLSTVAVNLADCAPFGSANGKDLSLAEHQQWMLHYNRAIEALDASRPETAESEVTAALAIDDKHAGLHYLRGEAALARSNRTEAAAAFARARDLDVVPLRTDSRMNQIIASVAALEGVELIPAADVMGRSAPAGVPGAEFFYEHVHFTPEGNYALARIFAEALTASGVVGKRSDAPWPTQEDCERHLALTPWGRYSALEQMIARCIDAPFTNRLDNDLQVHALASEAARLRRGMTPETAAVANARFTNAIAARPGDHYLHRSYGEFLEATGQLTAAAAEWQKVRDLLPHHPVAWLQAGSLLRRAGRVEEALPLIDRAIAIKPDWADAHLERLQSMVALGRGTEALEAGEAALKLDPENARVHLRLADAQAVAGDRDAAIRSLETAVRLNPDLWEARYYLGVEYGVQDRVDAAREQFAEVVRLKPDHARARFNLGVALAKQQRWAEAAQHLAEAVRLDPSHQESKTALSQVRAIQERLRQETPPSASPR